jgi:hypothetical protein
VDWCDEQRDVVKQAGRLNAADLEQRRCSLNRMCGRSLDGFPSG